MAHQYIPSIGPLEHQIYYKVFCATWEGEGEPPSEDSKEFQEHIEGIRREKDSIRKKLHSSKRPPTRLDKLIGAVA